MSGRNTGEGVPVWDPFIRIFHWALGLLIAAEFITQGDKATHEPLGYAILGLLALRLVWGVVGPRRARFADFVRGPGALLRYLRQLRTGHPPRYLGHNPAGGAMIVLLLASVAVVAGTGWMSETNMWFGVDWVSTVHSAGASVLVAFIGVHVLGVLAGSLLHKENLIRAMFTGRKPAGPAIDAGPHDDSDPADGALSGGRTSAQSPPLTA